MLISKNFIIILMFFKLYCIPIDSNVFNIIFTVLVINILLFLCLLMKSLHIYNIPVLYDTLDTV